MLILITGGSGSGKSAYAEEYIGNLAGAGPKYYIATMQVYDEEGRIKIKRHRAMRSGKGFETIEQPVRIEEALLRMQPEKSWAEEGNSHCTGAALLECMSNLAANEMFSGEEMKSCEETADRIASGVKRLNDSLEHLVIVTNNVFEDGRRYDDTTMEYIRLMGMINRNLAAMADRVIEVVVGIPVMIKEGK